MYIRKDQTLKHFPEIKITRDEAPIMPRIFKIPDKLVAKCVVYGKAIVRGNDDKGIIDFRNTADLFYEAPCKFSSNNF